MDTATSCISPSTNALPTSPPAISSSVGRRVGLVCALCFVVTAATHCYTAAADGGYVAVAVNANADPSATSTTSIHSPTDTTSLCIISTPTYVGQRVVCVCLCVFLEAQSLPYVSTFCLPLSFISCSNPATPLPQTGSMAHCLRSLDPQFAWDFLKHFALKHDVFLR